MHLQDPPRLRKNLLAPLALAYAAGSFLHRALWLRARARGPLIPLIVIGSLRAGGTGKTPVTLELARQLGARGRRVGILAYRIAKGGAFSAPPEEVFPGSDWRASSDEAVLLARGARADGGNGARVFVTRDRERAWIALSRSGEFDVLVSDDGWMDARLRGAFRVLLTAPDENPGWRDLLPAGPFRLTAAALREADYVLWQARGRGNAGLPFQEGRNGRGWYHREIVPPRGIDADKPLWILCGLGNPPALLRSLRDAGIRVAGCSVGPDHGLPNLRRAFRDAAAAGIDCFACTEKDWIKLEKPADCLENGEIGKISRVGERVTLDPRFLANVDALLPPPTS